MKTLNIWEVRAEVGNKEPHLDVTANVVADGFYSAERTLMALIKEKVEAHNRIIETAPLEALAEHVIHVPDALKAEDYEIVCVRLLQQVITLEPCPSSPSETSET